MKRKILFISVIVLALALVGFIWAYSQEIGLLPIVGRYTNTTYDYALTVPQGWRLATILMLLLNTPSFGNRPRNDATVILTAKSLGDEWRASIAVNDALSSDRLPSYSDFLAGDTISIEGETGNPDPRTLPALTTSGSAGGVSGLTGITPIVTNSGVQGWRYEISQGSSTLVVVSFPIPQSILAEDGTKDVTWISLRTLDDGVFDEDTFESIYTSFEFSPPASSS